MAQKSLFDVGFRGGQKRSNSDSDNESIICTPTKRGKHNTDSDVETPNSKVKRKFRTEWLSEYEWLETKEKDGKILMFCTWCRKANKSNPYANSGSTNLQKSALDRHCNKNPDHLELANARLLVQSKTTTKDILEIQETKQSSEKSASKEAQLRTAYFVAKNNLPLRTHNKLIELQRDNGCPALQDKKTIYTSSDSQEQMIDAINDEIYELIQKDIVCSDFVGVIVDETTDITIHKKLNIYFKCFKANTSETVVRFVDCVSVRDGKAETLVTAITEKCVELGLDMMRLISMASDGASVMTGRKGGVGALLRKSNPRLVQVHCVAHRLALCAGQACKETTAFADYHHTVKNVYRYFHNSAVRYNKLREMENVLNDTEGDTHVTLKEPASFRWLSLEAAVKAIHQVYPALLLALDSEAATGSAEAKGILKSVKSVGFILRTAFLVDVLACVNKLCRLSTL